MAAHRTLTLVTGGAGFIGAHLARHVCAQGHRVVIADWLGTHEKWRNISDILLDDIVSPDEIAAWLGQFGNQVRAVIHMGAISDTRERDADLLLRRNCQATQELWTFCTAQQIPFLYASSAATYGDGACGFADSSNAEALSRLRPLNAYGWSKHWIDRRFCAARDHGEATPPFWAGLKFFNVYGPGEAHKGDMRSLISKQALDVKRGHPLRLFKSNHPDLLDGQQQRDFVYVADCCAIIASMLETRYANGLYNIGSGVASTWLEVHSALEKALGRRIEIDFVDMPDQLRAQYQNYSRADLTRLRQEGYRAPMTSLAEGVAKTLQAILPREPGHG